MKKIGCFFVLLINMLAVISLAESPVATPFPWQIHSEYDTASTVEEIAACESESYVIGLDIQPGIYTITSNKNATDSFSVVSSDGETETVDLSDVGSWSFYAAEGQMIHVPEDCALLPLTYAPGFQNTEKTKVMHSQFFTGYEMPTVEYYLYPMEPGISYYRITPVEGDTAEPNKVFLYEDGTLLNLQGVKNRDLFVEIYHCFIKRVPAKG